MSLRSPSATLVILAILTARPPIFRRFKLPKRHADAAAKSLQSCPTLCDPIDGSPPGYTIPGFSRQEHWSGLPFPSPMHESEKWNWSRSVVSDSLQPHGLQPSRLLRPWDFPGKSIGVGCHCLLHNRHEWVSILVILFHLSNSPCQKHTPIINDRFAINLDISEAKSSYFVFLQECLSYAAAATAAKSLQSCPTLCNPIDSSPPGSPISGILQAQEHWSGLPFPSPMHDSEK